MDTIIELDKLKYPEQSIRKALYWLANDCQWLLNENKKSWEVKLVSSPNDGEAVASQFHKLLNDFLLRHQLDVKTQFLREKIVFSALEKIANDGE